MVFPQKEDTVQSVRSSNVMPYVMSIVILFLIGVIFIGGVLYLRPTADPLVVITLVFGFLTPTGVSVAAFIKGQENHGLINSQLSAWKKEFFQMAHAEGIIAGTKAEQDRIVEEKRAAGATTALPTAPMVSAPIAVVVENPDPIPVVPVAAAKK